MTLLERIGVLYQKATFNAEKKYAFIQRALLSQDPLDELAMYCATLSYPQLYQSVQDYEIGKKEF